MASKVPVQLTSSERTEHIDPLLEAGWSMVEVQVGKHKSRKV